MKKMLSLALSAAVASVVFAAPAANAVAGGTTEGCTPGYWKVKQHHDSWQNAQPGNALTSMYANASMINSTKNMTLLQALQGGGGGGVDGAAKILARAAVAAWLAYLAILAPVAEELLLRGEAFARAQAAVGPLAAILVTALIFAAAHVSS